MHEIQLALRRAVQKIGWLRTLAVAAVWTVFLYPFFFLFSDVLPIHGRFATFMVQMSGILIWVFWVSLALLFAHKKYHILSWALGLQTLLQFIAFILLARYFISLTALCRLLVYGGLLFVVLRYTGACRAIAALFGGYPSRPAPTAEHPLYHACPWCGNLVEGEPPLCPQCRRPIENGAKSRPVCAECGAEMKPGQYICLCCGSASAAVPFRPKSPAQPVQQSVSAKRFCPNCGAPEAIPDSVFCMNCGSPLPAQDPIPARGIHSSVAPVDRVCENCGAIQQNDTLPFCTRCGATLKIQPAQPVTPVYPSFSTEQWQYVPPVTPDPDSTIAMEPSVGSTPAEVASERILHKPGKNNEPEEKTPAPEHFQGNDETTFDSKQQKLAEAMPSPLEDPVEVVEVPLAEALVQSPSPKDDDPERTIGPFLPIVPAGAVPISEPPVESEMNSAIHAPHSVDDEPVTAAIMPAALHEDIPHQATAEPVSSASDPAQEVRICACCGSPSQNPGAKFCMNCGTLL